MDNGELDELERHKIDALAEFAAGVGHELNNPLAIISGRAQQLLSRAADDDSRRSLAVIMAQVRRAYEMIADIRLFARPPVPQPQTFDVLPFLTEIANAQTQRCSENGITFELKAESLDNVQMVSDPTQIRVIIDALCKNSMEAMRDGRICLKCEQTTRNDEQFITFKVSDNGNGIPKKIRQLIFCPYFSGRDAGRGLGFGLSKAWRITQQLGGKITVKSNAKSGTAFCVELPMRSKN
jgi:signal transduction histidine kinase